MSKRGADVPKLSYPVALVLGLFGPPFLNTAGGFVTVFAEEGYDAWGMVVASAFILLNTVLGAAFGLMWPEVKWRWGVWLYGLPACLLSLEAPGLWFFTVWAALTLLPACAGAHAAGKAHLKFTAVDETV